MSATSVGEIGLDLVVNQNQFKKQMSGITSLAKRAGAALAAAFAVKSIADFGKQCLELGSDLQEVQNVVDVTFPHMTAQVEQFAKSAAQSFGLSETMAKRYTGTFGAMAKAFGFTESQAYEMSTTLTGLAGDVASFYNLTQDEAYTKLKSVFTGETETLKDLGVVMTQSALDAYALANGYGKTTAAMTEMEKVALRYAFVQQQLSAAQGDFARTSDSWANQTRIMSLQLQSIMATIGQGLINLFTPVIKIVNTVLGKIATLANAFKAFTELITGKKSGGGNSVAAPVSELASAADTASSGLTGTTGAADSLADSTKGVGSAAKKAAKEMKALMGFDQIQKLDSQTDTGSDTGSSGSGGGGAGGSLGSTVDFGSLAEGETVLDKTNEKLSALIKRAQELAALFKKGFEIGFGNSEKKIQSIQKHLDGIGKSLKEIGTNKDVLGAFNGMIDSIALNSGKIAGSFTSIGLTIANNLLGGIDKYLEESKGYISQKLVSIFNVTGELAGLAGDFAVALAGIFDIFNSEQAKQITADLIGIFSDGFLGVVSLALQFITDLVSVLITPVTENVNKIKLAFENILTPISTVLSTLHTAVQTTFTTIGAVYDEHVKPMFDAFKTGISEIVSTLLDGFNTYIAPVLQSLASEFSVVWTESIQPAINEIIKLVGNIATLVKDLWKTQLQPFINWLSSYVGPLVAPLIDGMGQAFLDLLSTVGKVVKGVTQALNGVLTFLDSIFTGDWEQCWEGVKEIFSGIWTAFSGIAEGAMNAINTIFSPVSEWFGELFGDARDNVEAGFKDLGSWFGGIYTDVTNAFKEVGNYFKEKFGDAYDFATGAFDKAKDFFGGVWDGITGAFGNITGWFKDKFSAAWQAVKDVFSSGGKVFEGIKDGILESLKGVINGLITGINNVIAVPFNAINSALDSLRNWSVTIGPWTLTQPFSWLPSIGVPQIPTLAQGGFVKPNTPQLAMIGDNRHQGEVVAPEDKLQEMALEAVKAAGGNGITRADLESVTNAAVMRIIAALGNMGFYLDGEQLSKAIQSAAQSIDTRFNPVEVG